MSASATSLDCVVGCDGSEDSEIALDWAAGACAAHPRSKIHLLEALSLPSIPAQPWLVPAESLVSDAEDAARRRLETLSRRIASSGVAVELHVRRFLPVEAIVELAAETGAGLVVLGRHGRSPRRLLVGSVSSGVSRLAAAPVAIVRGAHHASPPRSLLVALDGSEASRQAARAALRLFPAAAITAVAVRHGQEGLDMAQLGAEAETAGLAGELRHELLDGDPATRLLEYCGELACDLVVAGRTGSGPLRELLFGSVAEKLLQLAPCPVLFAH